LILLRFLLLYLFYL